MTETSPEQFDQPITRWLTFDGLKDAAFGIDIPDTERRSVERLIEKAEEKLIDRVPGLEARVASGEIRLQTVRGSVEDIVLRFIRNYRGLTGENTAGGFGQQFNRLVASGAIEVLKMDVKDLMPARRRVAALRVGKPNRRLP